MTYTGAMTMPATSLVLPQNAVMMNNDEMRYVEGGFPWVPVAIAVGSALYASWDSNGKTWKAIRSGYKKYKIYEKKKCKWTYYGIYRSKK